MWRPLEQQRVKVNFDGGYYQDLRSSSIGVVVRNDHGQIMGAYYAWNRNIPLVEAAEALVAIQSIIFSMEMGLD